MAHDYGLKELSIKQSRIFMEKIALTLTLDMPRRKLAEILVEMYASFLVDKIIQDREGISALELEEIRKQSTESVMKDYKNREDENNEDGEDQNTFLIREKMETIEVGIILVQECGLDPFEECPEFHTDSHFLVFKERYLRMLVDTLVKDSKDLIKKMTYLQLTESVKAAAVGSTTAAYLSEEDLDECIDKALVRLWKVFLRDTLAEKVRMVETKGYVDTEKSLYESAVRFVAGEKKNERIRKEEKVKLFKTFYK